MFDLPHQVRRSDRARRARLTVTREGEVVVVLPRRAPAAVAAQLLDAHAIWLQRQMRRLRAAQATLAARPALASGRVLFVVGLPYEVVLGPPAAARSSVVAHVPSDGAATGQLEVRLAPEAFSAAEALERWLRREARKVLLDRVVALAPVVGAPVPQVTIRGQRSRWGSASRGRRLSLNWRLILAPPSVLDYVVVHELAHLVVRGHSPRFWSLVRRHVPDADASRAWLRAHHAELLAALE